MGTGGGAGVDRSGGRGAADGGTGGAEAGRDGGWLPEGFRDDGGGRGGFLPIGSAGLGLFATPRNDATEDGRRLLLNCATVGGAGADAEGGTGGARMTVSGSERYGAWLSAPVFTFPPTFRSLGMPPARIPASCGGPDDDAPSPPSLLLLPLDPGGTGGASPPDCGLVCMPGTGGAPPGTGGAPPGLTGGPSETLPTSGADRSFTCVTFFKRAPFSMLLSSAP